MLKSRIVALLLAFVPWHLAAEPITLSVQVIDNQTREPVADARVIVNKGPGAGPASAEMVQKNRQFQPRSLLVPQGSEVNFPNQDNTQHHVYSFSPAKVFDIELYANQPEEPILFENTGVVEVGCNIHDRMQGFILVTDSALTARTNLSGVAAITMPAGIATGNDLSLSLWHPRLTNATETVSFTVSLPAADPVELALDLTPKHKETGRLDGLQKRFRDL